MFLLGKEKVDTFRVLHPGAEKVYTVWRNNLRSKNLGLRVDLFVAPLGMMQKESAVRVVDSWIEPNEPSGVWVSDHVPIGCELVVE
jgi:exonuclease III